MSGSGPRLIRDDMAEEILRQMMKPTTFGSIGFDPNRPPPRLTLFQKVRVWRSTARWWVHDRLFPDCHSDGW